MKSSKSTSGTPSALSTGLSSPPYSNVERRNSSGITRPQSYHPGRHINPTGYELDSELQVADLNIGMSEEEFSKFNKLLAAEELADLGMTTMEIEAKKRGQRWRNVAHLVFKNHHNLTLPELRDR